MKKLVIFAGHDDDTWETKGAKGVRTDLEKDGVYEEYDTNILIAAGAVNILRTTPGLTVYFPQENGRNMTLKERVDYANAMGADLMIDIHSNASASRTATGAAAFYWKGSANGKRAADIYAGFLKGAGFPLWSGGTYASNLQDGWSGFYMLRYSNMPGILLENFFFTTRSDLEDYLLNPAVQHKLMEIVANTALVYFGMPTTIQKDVVPVSNPIGIAKPITGKVEATMPASQNRPTRKKGDQTPEVGWIQRSLNQLGEKLVVDDVFGKDTEDALKRFQAKHGLEADGIYGPASRTKLEDVMRELNKPAATVTQSTDKAIVINSFIDYPAVQQLHKQTGYPIYERGALRGKVAKELIVAGGGKKGLEKFADSFTDLSGATWADTVGKVAAYAKK